MTTSIKTSKDIAASLRSSAFRRASFDGRTQILRAIPTWGSRAHEKSPSFPKVRNGASTAP